MIYLRVRERERQNSSIYWLNLQTASKARAGPAASSRSAMWVAGVQTLELPSSAFTRLLQGIWIGSVVIGT